MPLEVEDRPLRDALELQRLVQAILAANDEDETFFLEWKSSLELKKKDDIFAIARCILGMANRHPDLAATRMGGLGYMVIGAAGGTGGSPTGIARMDEVDLANKLSSYLGTEHPMWTASWTQVEQADVLVITVEPPKWGDPIWLLEADYQDARNRLVPEGTVFIRDGTKTKPANAAQHRMLQERMRRSPAEAPKLDLTVNVGGEELVTFDWASTSFEAWLSVFKRSLATGAAPDNTPFDKLMSGDVKLPKDHIEKLSDYTDKIVERAFDVAVERTITGKIGKNNGLHFSLYNPGTVTLQEVEMALRIPARELLGVWSKEEARWEDLPAPPPKPKSATAWGLTEVDLSYLYSDLGSAPVGPMNPRVTVEDWDVFGDVVVRIRFGDVRGLSTVRGPSVHPFPLPSLVNSSLEVHYTVTTPTINAVQQGSYTFQIGPEVVPFNRAVPIERLLDGGL